MSQTLGVISLLPPLVAVGLALWKKQLIPALFLGILAGKTILARGHLASAFLGTLDNAVDIAANKNNLEIILFCFLIGSLLSLIKESNGFQGLVRLFERSQSFRGKATIFPLTFLLAISIFIESWSSMLITGAAMRPLYVKLKIAKERLAYFLHTISLNFVAMIVINSWGAYYIMLLANQHIENPIKIIVHSIPYNFYCLMSLAVVILVMMTGFTIGPMREAENRAGQASFDPEVHNTEGASSGIVSQRKHIKPSALNMILPTMILMASVFWGLYHTGRGKIYEGSGSAAVFYAGVISIVTTSIYYLVRRYFHFREIMEIIFKGAGDLISIGVLLVFALTMGDVCRQMGTGVFLADLVKHNIPSFLLPAIVFATSCVISFSTGTAYGTLAIMVPIAMPMAGLMGINPAFVFGACVSGGVFGNNCSPIADTSIIASMAAEVNVLDHIKTQLPYALISATGAFVLFALVGLIG